MTHLTALVKLWRRFPANNWWKVVCCGMFSGNLKLQASTPISSVFVYIRDISVDCVPPPAGRRSNCSPYILLLGHRPPNCIVAPRGCTTSIWLKYTIYTRLIKKKKMLRKRMNASSCLEEQSFSIKSLPARTTQQRNTGGFYLITLELLKTYCTPIPLKWAQRKLHSTLLLHYVRHRVEWIQTISADNILF